MIIFNISQKMVKCELKITYSMKLTTYLYYFQNEKKLQSANPGFEGIKKWLEVFLLSANDVSVPEEPDGTHLQLSTLIMEEFEKLKSVYLP